MTTTILLLDDEQSMFKTISRLLRSLETVVFSTPSVERAIEFCNDREVQLIITEINRPGVDVNHLLKTAAHLNPHTRKLVLTSFADIESTISAINEGKINRYFTKPWDPHELRAAIIEELDEYSRSCESASTADKKSLFTARLLEGTVEMLLSAHHRADIEIFCGLLEHRKPGSLQFAKQVAKISSQICDHLGLTDTEKEKIVLAAELHQLGYLGLKDEIINKPVEELSETEVEDYKNHPIIGEAALRRDQHDDDVALFVRHQKEDFEGRGYPDQLCGELIPLGSRIIRVASDYQTAKLEVGPSLAFYAIGKGIGTKYDPKIVCGGLKYVGRR